MRRWMMLALGTAAQTVACVFVYGLPYASDTLRSDNGLTLSQVGVLIACPTAGLVLTLVAWGALADRYGERAVITAGLAGCAVTLALSARVHQLTSLGLLFMLAGGASASVYAASGRLVVGWFPARERGLAMGIRQTSTPLGMGVAALIVPTLTEHGGLGATVLFCAALCAGLAVLIGLLAADPPRPGRGAADGPGTDANPYRRPTLWRVHAASALLCVPQFTAAAFALVLLVDVRGWSTVHAGQLIALAQVLGAASRIAAGRWSDRVGSRLRPMRQLSVAITLVMAATAVGVWWPSPCTALFLFLACGITASSNGLAFTATAELAGHTWSGRAMGVQNTGQNLAASLTPVAVGALIGSAGYAWGFVAAGLIGAVACCVIPIAGETRDSGPASPKGSMRAESSPASRP
ncbi:MFS transporter [Streptomyces sp. NPDC058221]|uniref:MFS transporter n=1 Tax=Streptomyces sp. NPDC058221 TaxID=3346388 RepID=UPI0036E83E8C